MGNVLQTGDAASEDMAAALALLIHTAIGCLGNGAVIALILIVGRLRRANNALIFHQALIDFLRSGYCVPFAISLLSKKEPPSCQLLGSSYIILVTTALANTLGMMLGEACRFSDDNLATADSSSVCCVIFGIVIIWFASCIINLSIVFISMDPSWNPLIGNCLFQFGSIKPYVLYTVWFCVILILGILITVYTVSLYREVKSFAYHRLATLIRSTIQNSGGSEKARQQQRIVSKALRRILVLAVVIAVFLVCWTPVLTLMVFDYRHLASGRVYKALMVLAYCNPAYNPLILIFLQKCRRQWPFWRSVTRTNSTNSSSTAVATRLREYPLYTRVGSRLGTQGAAEVD